MQQVKDFQETIWDYYARSGRNDLPWRQTGPNGTFDPYKIMVSEIMLQQTQVSRVTAKYQEFLATFPNIECLANASFSNVLALWNGLGYNRRAKFLLESAKVIRERHNGRLPKTKEELIKLPGIGPNTALAILVYAFDQPHVFIETNIRTVYIHHFFANKDQVDDKELMPYIQATLDSEHPRQWYWALMDYGSYLKTVMPNPSRRSKHHIKQSAFEGSRRQLRAKVLKILLDGSKSFSQIKHLSDDERTMEVLVLLEKEGLITLKNKHYYLA